VINLRPVTNNKRLRCARRFVLLKLTTDRHEASRGLFATAELLVRADDKVLIKSLYQLIGYNARQFVWEFSSKGWTRRSLNRLLKDAGSRHHRLEAASHRYTWKHSAEHHRQGRWSMESTTACMRQSERASFSTSAIINQFFSEPPTVYRRKRDVALYVFSVW